MNSDDERKSLSPEEKEFVDRLAAHYTPPLMTPAQRVAFDRALEERITRRGRIPFFGPVAGVAAACAALLIWLTMPQLSTHWPNGETQPGVTTVGSEGTAFREGEENLLTYAYYTAEFYDDEGEEADEDFLPDEYEALDTVLALPEA